MDDKKPGSWSRGFSRRNVLKNISAAIATGVGITSASGNAKAVKPLVVPNEYSVTGRQISTVTIKPNSVTLTKKKISADLRRRYGLTPPILSKTTTFDRLDPHNDPYPKQGTETVKRKWDTHYATESEWMEFLSENRSPEFFSPSPGEENHPYGIWEYEQINNGYEIAAPMNLLSEQSPNRIANILTMNSWTTTVIQYNRWAWNSATNAFQTQEKSVATGTFGVLGRKHLRMWQFGGFTSGSAHIDSAVPHTATSYDGAEEAIEQIFDDVNNWQGIHNYYELNNTGQLDHDGKATKIIQG